jgi:hypothetical protein
MGENRDGNQTKYRTIYLNLLNRLEVSKMPRAAQDDDRYNGKVELTDH